MKLSEHFSLSEFERSATATKHGIDNRVPSQYIPALQQLCKEILEPLRSFAGEPIRINSGYRCPRLNAAVGGSPTSNHLRGCAADLRVSSESEAKQWFDWLKANTLYDELFLERTSPTSLPWIHVALRAEGNRGKVKEEFLK